MLSQLKINTHNATNGFHSNGFCASLLPMLMTWQQWRGLEKKLLDGGSLSKGSSLHLASDKFGQKYT